MVTTKDMKAAEGSSFPPQSLATTVKCHTERFKMVTPVKMAAPQNLLSLHPSQVLSKVVHSLSSPSRAVHGVNTYHTFPALAYSFHETPLQELSHRSCPQWQHLLCRIFLPSLPPKAPQKWLLCKSWLQPGRTSHLNPWT